MNLPINVEALQAFLPHRKPAVWIDEVVSYDDEGGVCRIRYNPAGGYVSDGKLRETCFLEWIAQSYGFVQAARGLANINTTNLKNAFLVAVNEFEIFDIPPLNNKLIFEIAVQATHQAAAITLVQGNVFSTGKLLAKAKIKLFSR